MPLYYASYVQHNLNITETLLSYHADINARDKYDTSSPTHNMTCLMYVVQSIGNLYFMAKYLFEQGADVNLVDGRRTILIGIIHTHICRDYNFDVGCSEWLV